MVINPLKAFLFLTGGVVAAGATAYVSGALDPYLFPPTPPPAEVAALPEPSAPADPKTERLPAAEQPAEPAAPAAETTVVPSFDVVRVEPDGSVVIAGNAAPQSLVEVIAQEQVLASSKADGAGAFAIVFDTPLKPGDYQLSLRATDPNNVVVASTETAVISIPETPSGEVLAMVEEPGKPAEIITAPQPAASAPAAAEQTPAEAAAQPTPAETPSQPTPVEASAQPAVEQPAGEAKPAAEGEAATQPPASEPAAAATTEEPKPAAPETVVAGND
ncbi:MAG: peptigoglycan-binding protein LysM, partial [Rhizobiaceae bacterium]